MPDFVDQTTCAICGDVLHRHWNFGGTESAWLDSEGSIIGSDQTLKPAGVETFAEYLTWLKLHDIRTYSAFTAAGTAMLPPWQHRHQAVPVAPVFGPGETVPECCGMPTQLVRDGWLCRVRAVMLIEDGAGGVGGLLGA
jgi:hypothetical protein